MDALQLKPEYCIVGIGINDSIDLEEITGNGLSRRLMRKCLNVRREILKR